MKKKYMILIAIAVVLSLLDIVSKKLDQRITAGYSGNRSFH